MKTTWNWKTITGLVLHVLVAGIMTLAGSAKVLGLFPPDAVAKSRLDRMDHRDRCGRTRYRRVVARPTHRVARRPAGQLLLGRRHLSAHVQGRTLRASVRPAAAGLGGAYLRVPGVLASFSAPSKAVRPSADVAEVLVP